MVDEVEPHVGVEQLAVGVVLSQGVHEHVGRERVVGPGRPDFPHERLSRSLHVARRSRHSQAGAEVVRRRDGHGGPSRPLSARPQPAHRQPEVDEKEAARIRAIGELPVGPVVSPRGERRYVRVDLERGGDGLGGRVGGDLRHAAVVEEERVAGVQTLRHLVARLVGVVVPDDVWVHLPHASLSQAGVPRTDTCVQRPPHDPGAAEEPEVVGEVLPDGEQTELHMHEVGLAVEGRLIRVPRA